MASKLAAAVAAAAAPADVSSADDDDADTTSLLVPKLCCSRSSLAPVHTLRCTHMKTIGHHYTSFIDAVDVHFYGSEKRISHESVKASVYHRGGLSCYDHCNDMTV